MKAIKTERTPKVSFPRVPLDKPIKGLRRGRRWQVVCGDKKHYRIGLYSPEVASVKEIPYFEKHSCDEFFILLEGAVSIAFLEKKKGREKIRVVPLKPLQPMLVRNWHAGLCPKGAFTGRALVVERDQFLSWMKPPTA